jgi:putative FmdB family regulatory protein
MPFYEYECQNCKFYMEVMQKVSDEPLTRCPSCGKRRLKKLVSAPVFRLKGGGWYETDFKSDKESKRNVLADKDETAPPAKTESAEGKPAGAEDKGTKTPEGKSEPKTPAPKAAADGAASASRKRVSVPVKGVRSARSGRSAGPATRGARARSKRGRRR